jgi:5-methylcytosine-specific restriction endonuclease McrA
MNNPVTLNQGVISPIRPCANCATAIFAIGVKAFCSPRCTQTAKAIRYWRGAILDGRVWDEDVYEAIGYKVGFVLGGYPEAERVLDQQIRRAVVKRDGGRCRICGKPGHEVDHILGSSDTLENLQYLCKECHREKTAGSMRPPTESERLAQIQIRERAESLYPYQPCDMYEVWAWRHWGRVIPENRSESRGWFDWASQHGFMAADPAFAAMFKDGFKPEPVTVVRAASGHPPEFSPWVWYLLQG